MVRFCPTFRLGKNGGFDVTQVPEVSFDNQKRRATIKPIGEDSPSSSETFGEAENRKETPEPKKPTFEKTKPSKPEKKKKNKADTKRPISSFIDDDTAKNKKKVVERKEGVVASGIDSSKTIQDLNYQKYGKDEKSFELIKKALLANDFLKNLLDEDRLTSVVEAMSPQEYAADSYIIKEGESGSHLYVSAEGVFEVIKNGQNVNAFGPGEAFGELAILYKAKRFASIKVSTAAKVWTLERRVFQKIMIRSGKQEQEDNVKFLSSCDFLEGIHYADLVKISDLLKREFFPAGRKIISQGEKGDKFYIIRGGTVGITKRAPGESEIVSVGELSRGKYFGEQALLHDKDRRLATVTAKAPGVECLTLDKGPFHEFLGDIKELKEKRKEYTDARPSNRVKTDPPSEYDYIQFQDLEILGTLGVGGFGRVELVQYKKDRDLTFALKCLKKIDVVQQQQQEHAFNEKSIMYRCRSSFICRLFKTFKDDKYLYFLMEPILGGDVWSILQKRRNFNDQTARFMTACVVEALEHLHNFDIIYRDLKPENLMIDEKGYVKLVDFGYAKYLTTGSKSYTFAGTPEYVAPEIVLGKGHDKAVDFWALGIFVHELLVGKPPFRGTNHAKTYNLILRGIDAVEFNNSKISKVAQALIKKFCRPVPTERLGYLKNGIKDIKNHKWFLGFDWDKLRDRNMAAPLVIPISSNTDRTNFDKYPKGKHPPDETSGWDADF